MRCLHSRKLIPSFLFTDSDDSDDLVDEEDEPEMDLEMQMAYKEFIKGGKDKKSE